MKYKILATAFLLVLIYGIIDMTRHFAIAIMPISCGMENSEVDFFHHDLNAHDIYWGNRFHFWIACTKRQLTIYNDYWMVKKWGGNPSDPFDIDDYRMGHALMRNIDNKQKDTCVTSPEKIIPWEARINERSGIDLFETLHSIPEGELPKLMKLCNNAKSEKAIVRYIYNKFSQDGYTSYSNILKWLEKNDIEYSTDTEVRVGTLPNVRY
ncbi:MAG: hypothetical protein E7119_04695 [Bacteroidales bacterium]|nr:hypothetical protein [Bacteroidales bacterium]